MHDIKKRFAKWKVDEYLTMHVPKGKEADCELNFGLALLDNLHTKWRTATHLSKLEYYIRHINSQYWETYKLKSSEAQVHIQTPMPRKARRAITHADTVTYAQN